MSATTPEFDTSVWVMARVNAKNSNVKAGWCYRRLFLFGLLAETMT